MPTVLRVRGFQFYFFSQEGSEPAHIHVERGDGTAKYWLNPIRRQYTYNFSPREIRQIERIVTEQRDQLLEAWDGYFNQSKQEGE